MPYLPTLYTDTEVLHWIETVVLPGIQVILAAMRDGHIVGFAAIRANYLDHLYVSPAAQGCSIGTQLLAATKTASSRGLRLHVFQRNVKARMFYERQGFRVTARRDGSQNEEREPDAVYEWQP